MVEVKDIQGKGIFAGVQPARLAPFAELGEWCQVATGEYLFRLGDGVEYLYVLDAGKVDLTIPMKVQGNMRELSIETVLPGGTLAWSALVKPHVLTLNARAVEESRLIRFSGSALEKRIRQEPEIGLVLSFNVCEIIAKRFQQVRAMWLRQLQRDIKEKHG